MKVILLNLRWVGVVEVGVSHFAFVELVSVDTCPAPAALTVTGSCSEFVTCDRICRTI